MLIDTTLSTLFLSTVFFAGIISFFSPCIFPLLPVYIGNLIGTLDDTMAIKFGKIKIYWLPILKTLAFIFGLSFVFVILGYGAGSLGQLINSPYTNVILGIIVISLGIHQMELINISLLQKQKTITLKKQHAGIWGPFLLGLTFSFGWTPCIGPVLSSVLAIAATGQGGTYYGVLLMAVYSLGLAIPFLVLSLMSSLLVKSFDKIKTHMLFIKRIGGILIVLMGLLLMSGQLNTINQLLT